MNIKSLRKLLEKALVLLANVREFTILVLFDITRGFWKRFLDPLNIYIYIFLDLISLYNYRTFFSQHREAVEFLIWVQDSIYIFHWPNLALVVCSSPENQSIHIFSIESQHNWQFYTSFKYFLTYTSIYIYLNTVWSDRFCNLFPANMNKHYFTAFFSRKVVFRVDVEIFFRNSWKIWIFTRFS